MGGTAEGGMKCAAKNLARDPFFYHKIGAKGGRNGNTGGFASRSECNGKCGLNHVLGDGHTVPQCAGFKGGLKSRRRKNGEMSKNDSHLDSIIEGLK